MHDFIEHTILWYQDVLRGKEMFRLYLLYCILGNIKNREICFIGSTAYHSTIYGSKTTSTRQVKRLRRRYFLLF